MGLQWTMENNIRPEQVRGIGQICHGEIRNRFDSQHKNRKFGGKSMKMNPEDFIEWIAPTAVKICSKYGLYPSVCIAQSCIESGWGEATIGEFNLFGRKAVSGDKSITLQTSEQNEDGSWIEIDAPFKLYDSLDEAIEDYCILLTEEPCYMGALIFIGKDRDAYIEAMARVYATSQEYANSIKNTIRANNLTQFD